VSYLFTKSRCICQLSWIRKDIIYSTAVLLVYHVPGTLYRVHQYQLRGTKHAVPGTPTVDPLLYQYLYVYEVQYGANHLTEYKTSSLYLLINYILSKFCVCIWLSPDRLTQTYSTTVNNAILPLKYHLLAVG
jgi:hypothetical protein